MRITRDFILKFTNETIERRARSGRDLQAAYLCGSFLDEDYLLGGAADVDLFLVHSEKPPAERELVRLTDDIHLDIVHHDQRDYRDTRSLRVDPWLGPAVNNCKILFDPQHFMDFVRASVRGQFDRPDHIYQRAGALADKARETWFHLQGEKLEPGPAAVSEYLSAVGNAANAIASLSGQPLTERRLLLDFMARAEALERPGLYQGFLGLLGAPNLKLPLLGSWLSSWAKAFLDLPQAEAPERLHSLRLNYYLEAFREMVEGESPVAALWPLLATWTVLSEIHPADSPHRVDWRQAAEQLGLYGQSLTERIEALDAYLDLVEETLETWAQVNGAWESA
jgi:hypothetical protein